MLVIPVHPVRLTEINVAGRVGSDVIPPELDKSNVINEEGRVVIDVKLSQFIILKFLQPSGISFNDVSPADPEILMLMHEGGK